VSQDFGFTIQACIIIFCIFNTHRQSDVKCIACVRVYSVSNREYLYRHWIFAVYYECSCLTQFQCILGITNQFHTNIIPHQHGIVQTHFTEESHIIDVFAKHLHPTKQQQLMPNSSNQQTSSLSGLKIALVALCLILPWIPYATVRIIFNAVESRVSSLLEQRQTLAQDLGHIIHRNNKLQGKDQEYDIGQ
jgi:hypothetical protein